MPNFMAQSSGFLGRSARQEQAGVKRKRRLTPLDRRERPGPVSAAPNPEEDRSMAQHNGSGEKRLRSRRWFDEPSDPAMTALYLERYMNYGITPDELRGGKPIIGIAQTGSDLSPCNRHHIELASRIRDG